MKQAKQQAKQQESSPTEIWQDIHLAGQWFKILQPLVPGAVMAPPKPIRVDATTLMVAVVVLLLLPLLATGFMSH